MIVERHGSQMLVTDYVVLHAEVVFEFVSLICMGVKHTVAVLRFMGLLQRQVARLGNDLYLLELVRLGNRKPDLQWLAGIGVAHREVVIKNKVPRFRRLGKRNKAKQQE